MAMSADILRHGISPNATSLAESVVTLRGSLPSGHCFWRASRPKGRLPGGDPQGRSYSSFASFRDPDADGWLLQEVTTRLPGLAILPVATSTHSTSTNV